jgi:hypothetical protein
MSISLRTVSSPLSIMSIRKIFKAFKDEKIGLSLSVMAIKNYSTKENPVQQSEKHKYQTEYAQLLNKLRYLSRRKRERYINIGRHYPLRNNNKNMTNSGDYDLIIPME